MATITYWTRRRSSDRAGRIEETGVAYIPEAERDSRPANLAAVFFGGNLAFSVIVFGWLPVTFGLGWWATVTACAARPRARHAGHRAARAARPAHRDQQHGLQRRALRRHRPARRLRADARVRARLRGDRGVDVGRRAGRGRAPAARHAGRRRRAGGRLRADRGRDRARRAVRPRDRRRAAEDRRARSSACCCCSASSPSRRDFHAGGVGASTCSAASGRPGCWRSPSPPPARCPTRPSLGDYTRRISRSATATGRCSPPPASACSAACSRPRCSARSPRCASTNLGDSYVADLVAAAPGWYVLPILVIGLAGGVGQGVLNLYASGLDLEALVPQAQARAHDADHVAGRGRLLYLGTFALDAVDSITAMTLVLNGVAAPWVVVNLLGFLVARRGTLRPARPAGVQRRAAAAGATGSPAAGTCARSAPGPPAPRSACCAVTTDALHRPAGEPRRRRRPLASPARRSSPPPSTCIALAVWPEGEPT